ncbi:hypothetical protein HG536_0G00880 [Torulaspora globosa]|uniref:C2H2-type domain-containing protein n=1 Tax=Torulaspora globosa TaxID=48254 RepID=A0A7G3ZL45_9SACH|nr:uncharacterized protein HG536_0G00880 [Torulaspora globosa]QLL34231.1 hypothetical protein HG536_0G00880 [Torulaspora globosa]
MFPGALMAKQPELLEVFFFSSWSVFPKQPGVASVLYNRVRWATRLALYETAARADVVYRMSPGFAESVLSSRATELQQDGFFHTDDMIADGNSVNSLSLDIRNTSGSVSTTLHTTGTTNTPATNVNSFPSPELNGELGVKALEQQQNSAVEQPVSSGSSGTNGGGVKSYEYYKAGQRNGSGGSGVGVRISHSHTLSTPTAMSDFIAMLDAQSAIQQQWKNSGVGEGVAEENMVLGQSSLNYESNSDLSSNEFASGAAVQTQGDSGSLSPLQKNGSAPFVEPNVLKNNMFMDSFAMAAGGEYDVFQQPGVGASLDEYVSAELVGDDANARKLAQMHSNAGSGLFSHDRRHSEVITQALPEVTAARGSISHSIDFWNLDERRATQPAFGIDNDVTQVLNDYNMSFTRTPRRASSSANPGFQRHGVKKQPRGSMSVLDGSLNNDLFSKLYKNGSGATNVKLVPWENSVFSDEDEEYGTRGIDSGLPNLEPIVSPQSPKSEAVARPKNQQFIKPSMMLSENASTAAKMATTGTEKIDLISNLDNWNYELTVDPTMKIRRSPPPHYQTIKPSAMATINSSMSAPAASRRRRSTPNIMTIRNGSSGASIGGSGRGKSRSITPMSGTDEEAKPFKCKECSKAFRRSEHLKRHIRSVHSSERPFACMFCEKKFSRSDNLSQHLKTHKKHGDF